MKSTLKRVHRTNALVWVTFSLLFCISILAHASDSETFTSFDFPGAIDEMTGGFTSPDASQHGALVRNGVCTQIDFPGGTATYANGINPQGDIVGRYTGADGKGHGYLRTHAR